MKTVRRGAYTFRLPLAVIAVAVLDHAFAGREPGTAATDQLASGLMPVVAALALACQPRRPRPWSPASRPVAAAASARTGIRASAPAAEAGSSIT
jgi:hypothetical protein